MPQVILAEKYSNFFAPKNQIRINTQDINQKFGITASVLAVEKKPDASTFRFLIDDLQAKWIDTPLFAVDSAVEVKMGYASALETIISGEVSEVKSVFSSSHGPQIEVCGEDKRPQARLAPDAAPVCSLVYGNTLLNFTAIETKERFLAKTSAPARASAIKIPTNSVHCVAECIGVPEIKPGAVVTIAGLAKKFNHNYLVEKASHSWDSANGFRTRFEGKAQPNSRIFVAKG